MKRAYFIVLLSLAGCSKEVVPNLSDAFVGNFYLSEKNQVAQVETIWKVSRQNENHINVSIEGHIDYLDSRPDEHVVFTIKDVLVEFENSLKFDNEYDLRGIKGKVTGSAALTGDVLTYDLTVNEGGGIEQASKKLYRR